MVEDGLEEATALVMETPVWNPRPIVLSDIEELLRAAYHGLPVY